MGKIREYILSGSLVNMELAYLLADHNTQLRMEVYGVMAELFDEVNISTSLRSIYYRMFDILKIKWDHKYTQYYERHKVHSIDAIFYWATGIRRTIDPTIHEDKTPYEGYC